MSDIIVQNSILNIGACETVIGCSFRVVCSFFTAHLIRQLRHELGFSSFIYNTAQCVYCSVVLSVQSRQ